MLMWGGDFGRGIVIPLAYLAVVVIPIVFVVLWSWLSSSHGSVCCRNCREVIPNPGEAAQCRSCGSFYDENGRIIGEPEILARTSKVDLHRFHATDNASNNQRFRREPGYKETSDD
jgi:hypothetical protein